MSDNYPKDWNEKAVATKTRTFVNELQKLSDKHGLYVTNANSDAGCGNIIDADGQIVVTDFVAKNNLYRGCYQELLGRMADNDDGED